MKAFFGAALLTSVAALAGVFAASELHEMTTLAGAASSGTRASTAQEATQTPSQPIRRRVNYSSRPAGAQPAVAAEDI